MEERKVPGKNELRKREPVIQVKNLYKVYRVGETKVYALNGVDFTMYRGEFCAIVGTSGSGKSTLLNMLAGLEKPTKGEIVIAGQHIEKLNENQLVAFRRERVGFIFQSYNLLGTMNAVENVALPLSFRGVPRGRRREMAEKYLKKSAIICRTRCPAGSSSVSALHGRWWYIQRSFLQTSRLEIWIRTRRWMC